jgi:dihydrofolate synthase/folylpolyglutamate synthase
MGRDFRYDAQQGAPGTWQQWSWSGRGRRYAGLAYPALRGVNQLLNASGVLAALEALRERLPVPAQAVRTGLSRVELPGRFQIVPGQPTLVLDVAHNPHAAAALAHNLDQMGFYPRTLAVFGAMADKDIAAMVRHLHPLIDAWYCTDLPTARAARADQLATLVRAAVGAVAGEKRPVHAFASPPQALHAALEQARPEDRILVFGSFYTVGAILDAGLPRGSAKHLAS